MSLGIVGILFPSIPIGIVGMELKISKGEKFFGDAMRNLHYIFRRTRPPLYVYMVSDIIYII